MNHSISLETAIQMTTFFRESKDRILQENLQGLDILPIAETFDRAAIDKLLSHPRCARLRIYYGMDQEQKIHAVLVGVDADDKDILPSTDAPATEGEEEAEIVELAQRCPPYCSQSVLNP
jgi:hypothetical protein